MQALRHAARSLAASPGLCVAAITTLAVGLGASAAIFSIVNGVLLQPLPYERADRLVQIWETQPDWVDAESPIRRMLSDRSPVAYPTYQAWSNLDGALAAASAYRRTAVSVESASGTESVDAVRASATLFDVLGVDAAIGRTFQSAEERVGGPALVVLDHAFWMHRYGGDPAIIGQTLVLNDRAHTIVGVMPAEFYFPDPQLRLWATLDDSERHADWTRTSLRVIARLHDDASLETVTARLRLVTSDANALAPERGNRGVRVVSRLDEEVGGVRRGLLTLLGAVGLVLFVAAANVGGLLLVRAVGRRREFAIRSALGASRTRVGAQLVLESVLLASAGGALGVLVASWTLPVLVALLPADLPRLANVRMDLAVLAFATLASLVVGAAFGALPALEARRRSIVAALHETSGTASPGPVATRARAGLVVLQLAVSVVLVVAAVLLTLSLARLGRVDHGFDSARVLTMSIEPPASIARSPASVTELYDRVLSAVTALPGVAQAAVAGTPPLHDTDLAAFAIDGDDPGVHRSLAQGVTPGYFRVLGIRLVSGRLFTTSDERSQAPVAIISQAMARRFWPGRDPVGARIRSGGPAGRTATIVGVVSDARYGGPDRDVMPIRYGLLAHDPDAGRLRMVVRVETEPLALAPSIRRAVWSVDRGLTLGPVATMDGLVSASVSPHRSRATLLSVLAIVGVLLTLLGVYAVVSTTAVQRRRELAIRLAVGAVRGDLVRLTLAGALRLVSLGVAAGTLASVIAGRALEAYLFGVRPADPAPIAVSVALVSLAALAAALVPAWRASCTDPVTALRTD